MLKVLKNQEVPKNFVWLIKKMYKGLKSRILTDIKGKYFNVNRGLKQGSPILFNFALKELFRKLN